MQQTDKPKGLEAIAVKRATIADADKVRYRVYRSEGDFVAVIAESALMAMKVSGIMNPHRIVRDLPNEGVSIEAQRIRKSGETDKVLIGLEPQRAPNTRLKAELPVAAKAPGADFMPMQVKDFQKRKLPWARVLTPEMVEQAQAAPTAPAATPPEPETIEAAPPPEPVAAEETPPIPEADPGVLTEEEVQKLLNS